MSAVIRWALLGAAVLAAVVVIYARTAASDERVWHVDPLEARRTGRPNDFLMLPPGLAGADATSPSFATDIASMARRFDAIARSDRGVTRLAGSNEAGFITYVARSRWVGWPDYVSVKVVPAGEGQVALAIWSRARFGYSDFGVNRERVERWVAAASR